MVIWSKLEPKGTSAEKIQGFSLLRTTGIGSTHGNVARLICFSFIAVRSYKRCRRNIETGILESSIPQVATCIGPPSTHLAPVGIFSFEMRETETFRTNEETYWYTVLGAKPSVKLP